MIPPAHRHVLVCLSAAACIATGLGAQLLPPNIVYHDPLHAFAGLTTEIREDLGNRRMTAFDMGGRVANVWQDPNNFWYIAALAKPLPRGHVLAMVQSSPTSPRALVELDWNSKVVWAWDPTRFGVKMHHDFHRLANGNTLVVTQTTRVVPSVRQTAFVDELLIEIDPGGNPVWVWSAANNYAQLPLTPEYRQYVSTTTQGVLFHTNSIQALPPNRWEATDPRFQAGNVLVSFRNPNLVFIIDKQTGAVVWSYTNAIGQHHPRMIPRDLAGAGNIMVFDNGGTAGKPARTRSYSRVVELDPTTMKEVWTYECQTAGSCSRSPVVTTPFYSRYMSSAQRLPNGNTLITEGTAGRVFEVTPRNNIVWEYLKSSGQIYRSYRVPAGWQTAQLPPFTW